MAKESKFRFVEPEALAKLGRLNIVARSVVEGFVTGLHRSPYHGFSVEFAEHREYVPGDSIRHLDWLALARTDRYYVKQYEEETNLRAYILLDSSASMGFGSDGGLTKLEYSCYLAASLAYLMIRQQDSVGLVHFSEKINEFLAPSTTKMHLTRLLLSLEKTAPSGKTDISKTFHDLAERIKRRALIIIISDLYDDQKEVTRSLSHFRHKKHEVLLFHVLDHSELEFPYRRLADFVDMETGRRIQVDPMYVREEYRRLVTEFLDSYRRDCSQTDIDYVVTSTRVPYDLLLLSYLGKRRRFVS